MPQRHFVSMQLSHVVCQWWWKEKYRQTDTRDVMSYPDEFGRWLLARYNESISVNPIDNVSPPPRS